MPQIGCVILRKDSELNGTLVNGLAVNLNGASHGRCVVSVYLNHRSSKECWSEFRAQIHEQIPTVG